jgi:hypothetical protein
VSENKTFLIQNGTILNAFALTEDAKVAPVVLAKLANAKLNLHK